MVDDVAALAAPAPAPAARERLLRKPVVAWAAWDWGSSAFNAVVTTFVFTVWITSKTFVEPGQDVDATVALADLVGHGDAADEEGPGKLGALGVLFEACGHLVGEFAGRRENQRWRHARLGAAGAQLVDHRQGEGGGLAGAGLGDAQDVLAGKGDGDRLGLDRSRGRIAGIGHGLKGGG